MMVGSRYYTEWGKAYLDAGVRAFFFGQSRLTGGGRACDADGSGCSRVSAAGAAGFAKVLRNLKARTQEKRAMAEFTLGRKRRQGSSSRTVPT